MGDLARIGTAKRAPSARKPAAAAVAALVGAIFTVLAVLVGVVLFVVFAATLAVMILLASLLLGLAALMLRPRRLESFPQLGGRDIGAKGVTTRSVLGRTHPPAHAWITYQWDPPRA